MQDKSKLRRKPVEDVEINSCTSVTKVAEVIGRDATDIHVNMPRHMRLEDLLLLSHRVVHPKFLLCHPTYTIHSFSLSLPLRLSLPLQFRK